MKPKLLARIAAVLMVFHAAGHTMGMAQWKNVKDVTQQSVVSGMTDHAFPFMGAVHSYADSFVGFGIGCTIAMLLIAALLWVVGSLCNTQPQISKKILLLLFLSLTAWCVVEFIYFFPMATIITLLAAILTGLAMLFTKNHAAA